MRLIGASAVVTGGASGLGLATAARLVDAGARVVVVDLDTSAGAEVVARLGGGSVFAPAAVNAAHADR